MTITRHNKTFHAWKKIKSNKKKTKNKNEMRVKENKEKIFIKRENKSYEDLGYESSLCKESRLKHFCG